ncbi:MAG TPA: ClpX C4-type zinc finger protein [Candidatus Angelobacter sp.]
MIVTHSSQAVCSFCGKPPNKVRALIARRKLSNAYICDECLVICGKILNDHRLEIAPAVKDAAYRVQTDSNPGRWPSKSLRCSFCRRPQHVVEKLISSPQGTEHQYICDQCVRLSAEIINKTESVSSGPRRFVGWLKRKLGTHPPAIHHLS